MDYTTLKPKKVKAKIGDKEFIFSPLSLGKIAEIADAFKSKGLTYEEGIKKLYDNVDIKGSIDLSILFLHTILESPKITYVELEVIINSELQNRQELINIIAAIFSDSLPDYNFDEKKTSKTKSLVGWIILILATIGLMSMLNFAFKAVL